MNQLRDYQEWHQQYDDPRSGMSWRLGVVQDYLRTALNGLTGEVRVLSVCAGDGRDVIGVLAGRDDAHRVEATLLELHADIADQARDAASDAGLTGVQVRTVDAADTDAYTGAVPADIVVLVGIFGNISDADLQTLIATSPQFCAPGATLLWSRGREDGDRNDAVRAWFAAAGFEELDYTTRDTGSRPALGAMTYVGPAVPLEPGRHLFTFRR